MFSESFWIVAGVSWADAWQAFGAMAQVVVAVASLFIAWLAFSESRRAVTNTVRPEILIIRTPFSMDTTGRYTVEIAEVENVGVGIAFDFSIIARWKDREYGTAESTVRPGEKRKAYIKIEIYEEEVKDKVIIPVKMEYADIDDRKYEIMHNFVLERWGDSAITFYGDKQKRRVGQVNYGMKALESLTEMHEFIKRKNESG